MKPLLRWIADRLIEAGFWLHDIACTPDISMPYYPEGPEGDE